jgi:hypothetical protein
MNKKQIKEKGIELIKRFIYAQYDAFENRRENPEQGLGKKDHEYYWEAVGINVFLFSLIPDLNPSFFDDIVAECKKECKEHGCKKAYLKYVNYNEALFGELLTWDELVEKSKLVKVVIKNKTPQTSLFSKFKHFIKI